MSYALTRHVSGMISADDLTSRSTSGKPALEKEGTSRGVEAIDTSFSLMWRFCARGELDLGTSDISRMALGRLPRSYRSCEMAVQFVSSIRTPRLCPNPQKVRRTIQSHLSTRGIGG